MADLKSLIGTVEPPNPVGGESVSPKTNEINVLIGDVEASVKYGVDIKDTAAYAVQAMEEGVMKPQDVGAAVREGFLNARKEK